MYACQSAEDSGHYSALKFENGCSVRCLSALDTVLADDQPLGRSILQEISGILFFSSADF
jgi:hypothetical protein